MKGDDFGFPIQVKWTGIMPWHRQPGKLWWRFWFHTVGGGAPGIVRYHTLWIPGFNIVWRAWRQPGLSSE